MASCSPNTPKSCARRGLHRVTLSLDTLRSGSVSLALTGRDMHAQVLAGIAAARRSGFGKLKLDTVVLRAVNDDELSDLIEFGRHTEAEVRFIEYMDVGGATEWSLDKVFTRAEMLDRLGKRYGAITPLGENSSAPAERFRLPNGTVFGIMLRRPRPSAGGCDRSRLTADGLWYLCLYAQSGIDLRRCCAREPRPRTSPRGSHQLGEGATTAAPSCGAATGHRGVLVGIDQLRQDPHLEMHTRGG